MCPRYGGEWVALRYAVRIVDELWSKGQSLAGARNDQHDSCEYDLLIDMMRRDAGTCERSDLHE